MTSQASQRPMAGILWMAAAGACFVAVTALVKVLGARVPAAEQAFIRYVLGLVFLLPMIGPLRRAKLDARLIKVFTLRGAAHSVAVILWFYAMTRIPISEVTAMNYLSPVYVTLGAALFLNEKLAARRVIAIIVALIGVAIILRPGFREVNLGHLAMLGTAVLFGVSYITAKIVSDEVAPAVVVAMLSITVTIGLAPFAIAVWVWPTPWEVAMLFAVAIFATAGHYAMTLAFKAAPVTVTQPVTFLQLIWAVLLGALAFGEPVDGFVILGGLVILGAVTFISWREATLKRRAVTPTVNATKV